MNDEFEEPSADLVRDLIQTCITHNRGWVEPGWTGNATIKVFADGEKLPHVSRVHLKSGRVVVPMLDKDGLLRLNRFRNRILRKTIRAKRTIELKTMNGETLYEGNM